MSMLAPEGEIEPTTGSISRRRVLIGTAWATPAVVLAVATPPAAASTMPVAAPQRSGALAIASPSALYAASKLTVKAQVAYAANGAAAAVTGVTATMTFESWGMPAQTPTNVATGWQYLTSSTANNKITFTFKWNGADISYTNSAPAPLEATFANWSTSNGNVTIAAAGTSLNVPVTATAALTASAVAQMVWNSLGFSYAEANPWPNNNTIARFHYYFAVRNSGPDQPPASPATNIVVTATYNASQVTAPAAGTSGDWTIGQPVISGNVGKVTFTYSGSLALGASSSQVATSFAAKTGVKSTTIVWSGTYASAGSSGTIENRSVSAQ